MHRRMPTRSGQRNGSSCHASTAASSANGRANTVWLKRISSSSRRARVSMASLVRRTGRTASPRPVNRGPLQAGNSRPPAGPRRVVAVEDCPQEFPLVRREPAEHPVRAELVLDVPRPADRGAHHPLRAVRVNRRGSFRRHPQGVRGAVAHRDHHPDPRLNEARGAVDEARRPGEPRAELVPDALHDVRVAARAHVRDGSLDRVGRLHDRRPGAVPPPERAVVVRVVGIDPRPDQRGRVAAAHGGCEVGPHANREPAERRGQRTQLVRLPWGRADGTRGVRRTPPRRGAGVRRASRRRPAAGCRRPGSPGSRPRNASRSTIDRALGGHRQL